MMNPLPSSLSSTWNGQAEQEATQQHPARRRRYQGWIPPKKVLLVLLLCSIPLFRTIGSLNLPVRTWMTLGSPVLFESPKLGNLLVGPTHTASLRSGSDGDALDGAQSLHSRIRLREDGHGNNPPRGVRKGSPDQEPPLLSPVSAWVLSASVEKAVRLSAIAKQQKQLRDRILSQSNKTRHVLDVYYYDLKDPFFGDLVSSGFTEQETQVLLDEVTGIWLESTNGLIDVRFHRHTYVLDRDRAAAFLFYVVGHPLVSPTRPETVRWLMEPLRAEVERLSPLLKQVYSMPALIQLMEQALFPDGDQTQQKKRNVITRTAFHQMIKRALILQKEQPVPHGSTATAYRRLHQQKQSPSNGPHQSEESALQAAFDGLVGAVRGNNEGDEAVITRASLKDFLSARDQSFEAKQVHLAFRLLYVRYVGLTMERVFQFAEHAREKPLLFLQYAIGRDSDLTSQIVNRAPWDFANTLSVYPVPFYHAMNGRGSQNWMDVIYRTGSCLANEQRKRVVIPGAGDFGAVPCRWGARKWERHSYSVRELGRMIAHEIGHCIGLPHVQPHCVVYPSAKEANLMQQQRNIALTGWEKTRCKCAKTSKACNECHCDWNEENYREVGEARYLDEEQIAIASRHVRSRDFLESKTENGFQRIGTVFRRNYNGISDLEQDVAAMGMRSGDVVLLSPLAAVAHERMVNQLHLKARLALNQEPIPKLPAINIEAKLKLWAFHEEEAEARIDTSKCSAMPSIAENSKKWRDLQRETRFPQSLKAAHFEWPGLIDSPLRLQPQESLAIQFVVDHKDVQLFVNVTKVPAMEGEENSLSNRRACMIKSGDRLPKQQHAPSGLMINYDVKVNDAES